MRTGLTKRQKTTEIFFDETKSRITVYTHNTDLKKRLTAYAERYPDHCTMTDEDSETGYKAFEIEKGRLSFRLTAPCSEERRRAASDYAKKLQILCSKVIEKMRLFCYIDYEKICKEVW